MHLDVEVEGMNTYSYFDVIEFIDGGVSYPTLLGIGWANDSMEVINFKKRVMTFKNQDIGVIAPMDPNEGRRYVEPVKDEVVRGWDHAYKILEYCIHSTVDGELGWHNSSSVSSDFDVIEFVYEGGSYPALLGIGWANKSMALINFKKHMMTF